MTLPLLSRRAAAILLAALAMDAAQAVRIGQPAEVPRLGRPLDATIPVTLDEAGQELPCPRADVFFGRRRLSADEASVVPARTGERGATLAVRTSVPVDDAAVGLHVQVGCETPVSRHFVLIAERAPEPAPAAVAPAWETAAVRAAPRPRAERVERAERFARVERTEPAAPVAASTGAAVRAPRPAAQPAVPVPVAAAVPLAAPGLAAWPTPMSAAAPAATERGLRLSTSLSVGQPAPDAQRAAAAALWRALNAPADELLRDAQRAGALEAQLRAVQATVREQATTMEQLRGELQQARAGGGTFGIALPELAGLPRAPGLPVVAGAAALVAALALWWAVRRGAWPASLLRRRGGGRGSRQSLHDTDFELTSLPPLPESRPSTRPRTGAQSTRPQTRPREAARWAPPAQEFYPSSQFNSGVDIALDVAERGASGLMDFESPEVDTEEVKRRRA